MTAFLFQAAAAARRLIPLFDRVLIQRAEAVTKTKGGIVIPEKAQAKVLKGTVVAVGPGSRNQVSLMKSPQINVKNVSLVLLLVNVKCSVVCIFVLFFVHFSAPSCHINLKQ